MMSWLKKIRVTIDSETELSDDVLDSLPDDELVEEDKSDDDVLYGEDDSLEDDSLEDDLLEDDLLEDNLLEDDSLEDDSLEDDSLEDNSLEDDLLEDDSLEDNSLEGDSLEDDLFNSGSSIDDDILSDGSSIDDIIEEDSLSEFRGDDEINTPDISEVEDDDDDLRNWDIINSPVTDSDFSSTKSELGADFGLDDEILKNPDDYVKEVSNSDNGVVDNKASDTVTTRSDDDKVEDTPKIKNQNKVSSQLSTKSGLIASAVAGVLLIGSGVAAFVFGPSYLNGYIQNQDNVVRMEQRIIELEGRISSQGKNVTAKIESDFSLLSKKVDDLSASSNTQASENLSSMKRDLADFEESMLSRVGKVVIVANEVASRQKQQDEKIDRKAQEIKEQVLREVGPLVKSEIKNTNLDKTKLDESLERQKNTERKLSQLQAKYSAQRELLSLMEGELGYVKDRISNNDYGTKPVQPVNMTQDETMNVLVDSVKQSRDAKLEVEPVKKEDLQESKPKLSLSGVFSGPGGRFDIYVDVSGEGMSSVRPYLFTPNQVSEIPGYGRIKSVRKIKGSSARVPYVVETEGGLILGKK